MYNIYIMARMPRTTYAGALYHVFSRGDRGQYILSQESFKVHFANILIDALGRFKATLHSFCIMDNHYHLLIQTEEDNLPVLMHRIGSVYASYLQRDHGFEGHIFARRYNSLIVETNEYLLALTRYIHMNPVRAGMVKAVADYHWSSYKFLTGEIEAPLWMTLDWILGQFGTGANLSERYRAYMEEELDEERLRKEAAAFDWAISSGCRSLERALFEQTALAKLREAILAYYRLPDLGNDGAKATGPLKQARHTFAYLARTYTDQSNKAIAEEMGMRDAASITHYYKRAAWLLRQNHKEAECLKADLHELALIWGQTPTWGLAPN